MGMTIEEAIKYYENKNVVLTEEEALANTIALYIMRKYQKIQEIVKQKDYDRFNCHNYYGDFLRVQDIRKVLEDGKND